MPKVTMNELFFLWVPSISESSLLSFARAENKISPEMHCKTFPTVVKITKTVTIFQGASPAPVK
jgi:prepilin signal peptidase PulO-like enzyme (type II secretory pathway)